MIPLPDKDTALINEHAFYDGDNEKSSFLNLNYKFDPTKLLKSASSTTSTSQSSSSTVNNHHNDGLDQYLPHLSLSQFLIIVILASVIIYQSVYFLNHYLRHRRIHKFHLHHHSTTSHSRSNSGQKLEKPEDLV